MTRTKNNHKRNNRVWRFRLCVLFVMLVTLAACTKDQAPVAQQPSKPVAAKPATAASAVQNTVSSSVKLAPAQKNQLDFSSKKDPFKPFINMKIASGAKAQQGDERKPGLPIHSFDVSQFRLIGTVADAKGNKAMVVDPSGKGYVLRVGMTIGQNEGKITKIDISGVDVVEQSRDAFNKIRKETVRIPLLKKP